MDVQGDFKQKAMGTREAIWPPVYLQMKTAVTGSESFLFAESAELHSRDPSGPQRTLTTALAGVHARMFNVPATPDGRSTQYLISH